MELVYLWVENYKNIHEQGFNFSPRFECEYENNELTIIEKNEDEYIRNFFGENINVTAIVGKNGSGKSGILEFIREYDSEYKNGLWIVYKNNQLFINKKLRKDIEIKSKVSYSFQSLEKVFPLFDYSFIKKNEYNIDEKNYPKFPKNDLNENLNNIIWNYIEIKKNDKWSIFEDFFQPKIIKIDITNIIFNLAKEYKDSNFGKALQKLIKEIIDNFQKENINRAIEQIIGLSYFMLNTRSSTDSNGLSEKDFIDSFYHTFNQMNFPIVLLKKININL